MCVHSTAAGAHFDGEGDYMTVNSFNYGATADFTIGMWITKESCTASIYEYLFSQSKYPTGPPPRICNTLTCHCNYW